MKKKYLLFGIVSLLLLGNLNVNAASTNITVSKNNVYVGDSFEVYANMKGAAAWNIHVTASGPVSGCTINQADASADASDINKTFSAKCNATGPGKVILTLKGDVTSASDGNPVNIGGTVIVNITNKPAPPPTPEPKPKPNPNPKPTPVPPADNRSRNTNLKELKVTGYNLVKVNNNTYTLEVPNGTSKINLIGKAEDSKSKITGLGEKKLNIGENNIQIVVISEAGTRNIINIKVTRKDGYYIEDLDTALKENKNDIDIIIKKDTTITKNDLEKIKKSNKRVNLNYFDQNKKLIYKYVLEGNKIKEINEFVTTMVQTVDIAEEILKAANYSEGIVFNFTNANGFPKGTKIAIDVSSKYKDNVIINCYGYDKIAKELKLVNKEVLVKNGLVTINLDQMKTDNYLITRSNIENKKTIPEKEEEKLNNTLILINIVLILIAIILFLLSLKKLKQQQRKKK